MAVTDTVHPTTYDQPDLGRQWVESLGARRISYNSSKVYKPEHLDIDKVLPKEIIQTVVKINNYKLIF